MVTMRSLCCDHHLADTLSDQISKLLYFVPQVFLMDKIIWLTALWLRFLKQLPGGSVWRSKKGYLRVRAWGWKQQWRQH